MTTDAQINDRRCGEERRHEPYCPDCCKNDFNKMSGAAGVYRIIVVLMLTAALGSDYRSANIAEAANDANAAQNTQIAINSSAIVELRKLVEQNRKGMEKISDNQQKQTDRILDAIEGLHK